MSQVSNYAISTIINDESLVARMRAQGILTTGKFLKRASDPKGRAIIAQQFGLTLSEVTDLANIADLMRISGVGLDHALAIRKTGTHTLRELQLRNPASLHAKIGKTNDKPPVLRLIPPVSFLARWIEHAKQLNIIISY